MKIVFLINQYLVFVFIFGFMFKQGKAVHKSESTLEKDKRNWINRHKIWLIRFKLTMKSIPKD